MRILHVITTLDVGGAEMHLLSQVRGQSDRGHEVRVAYLKGEGRLAEDFRGAGARKVVDVGPLPMVPLRLLSHLRWAQIVHSHLLKADMLTAPLATFVGRRRGLVAGKHNDEQVLRRAAVSTVHGILGRLPKVTIPLSDHVARFVEEHGGVPLRKQHRIYYGLDPEPFEKAASWSTHERELARSEFGFAPEDTVFTCVARFAPQKAHDVLLRAFDLASKAWSASEGAGGGRLRMLLVGDDPFGDGRQRAEALHRDLGLGDAVHFAGIRRDVPRLLALSDVFVMSSLWEGLGLVFLEAMATGIPVLASGVSAVPEVVVHGETGVLVEPARDEPLAEGFLRLARGPGERRAMGEAGHRRVIEHFGLDRMVDETLGVYRDLLGELPGHGQ